MNNERTIIKQIILSFKPFSNQTKLDFRIRDVQVWTCDINHDYFLFDETTSLSDYNVYEECFDYVVEIYTNKDASDEVVNILKNNCKQTVKNLLNRKIKFYNENLRILEKNE